MPPKENPQQTENDPIGALRNSDYRYYLLSRLLLTLSTQIQAVVVGWQVYEITKDPLSLGLIGLAEAIPALGIAPFAGHFADRHRRKPLVLWAMLLMGVCSLGLVYISHEMGTGLQAIPFLYSVIFLSGLARGVLFPANFSFLAQIVPREMVSNAMTWNSAAWQLAAVSGPALGGLVYGFYGMTQAYAVDASLMVVTVLLFSLIPSRPAPEHSGPREPMSQSLQTGLRFVFSKQEILGAISLDLFAVLFGGAVALLPIFAKEILSVGPEGLGLLRAAPSAGAVLMSFFLAFRPPVKNSGWVLFYSVGGFGVCMILFALSENFYLSLFLLAVSGAFDNVSVVIRATIIQTMTPDHMRGRVAAVNTMFIGSSNEIGGFESGITARLMGTVRSVLFGGAMTLVVVSLTAMRARKLRDLSLANLKESE